MQTESDEERERGLSTELFDVDNNEETSKRSINGMANQSPCVGRTLGSPFNETLHTPREKSSLPTSPCPNALAPPSQTPKPQQGSVTETEESPEEELSEESDDTYFDSDCDDDDDDDEDNDEYIEEEKELTPQIPQIQQSQGISNIAQMNSMPQQNRATTIVNKDSDWNTRYQQILLLPKTTDREKLKRAVELKKLYDEFDESAIRIAKELVAENESPIKKYPPVSTNGIAGGQSKNNKHSNVNQIILLLHPKNLL